MDPHYLCSIFSTGVKWMTYKSGFLLLLISYLLECNIYAYNPIFALIFDYPLFPRHQCSSHSPPALAGTYKAGEECTAKALAWKAGC